MKYYYSDSNSLEWFWDYKKESVKGSNWKAHETPGRKKDSSFYAVWSPDTAINKVELASTITKGIKLLITEVCQLEV